MKHLKLFENFNEFNNESKLPVDLYNELLPYFEPAYNLERPSGHSLEIMEMNFNKNTKYEDIIDIILNSNWYVVKSYKDSDEIKKIEIRPKYSKFVEINYPKRVYHISPSSNDDSIMNNGLKSKNSKKMGINFPPRIYVVSELNTLNNFSKELNWYVGEKDWTIWEIDLTKLNIDYLYVDETVNQSLNKPSAFYLQEIDIPSSALSIKNRIVI